MKINNEMYSRTGYSWWGEENSNTLLRCFVNPVRFGYFRRVLETRQQGGRGKVLDVGCGGGFLAEAFASLGYDVTGIDPAKNTLREAAEHAAAGGLAIEYLEGCGENLPSGPEAFDIVVCCDVLEHVNDLGKVVAEIARVLKPGGLFFFDTVNRTLMSALTVIALMQEWEFTAFEEPGTHVWSMFVKPSELEEKMRACGLSAKEFKGLSSGSDPLSNLVNMRKRARGKISRYELGERMKLKESRDISISYMGYAVKK